MGYSRRTRLVAIGLIAILALSATLLLTPPEISVSVDYVINNHSEYEDETISVRGVVMNDSLDSEMLRFNLSGDVHTLQVNYESITISNAFSEGKTILVSGTLKNDDGELILIADSLTVGCPSKYEQNE